MCEKCGALKFSFFLGGEREEEKLRALFCLCNCLCRGFKVEFCKPF